MKSGVYRIVNTLNGKSYVGSATNIQARWKQHVRHCRKNTNQSIKFQRAWNKYGELNFRLEILEFCDTAFLISREQYWIDTLQSYKNGYNARPIANSLMGVKFSEATKKRMSDIRKGMRFSREHKENIKLSGTLFSEGHVPWNKSKTLSGEHKENIKLSGTFFSEGHVPWNKGRALSEEHKAKLAISALRSKRG